MNREQFLNPPKQYRPSPFWSWNDDLANDELAWQVRDMKEKGFGGYFMHSRIGLITEYLSDAWMDCIRATLEEGKRCDMESWLYDEDRWPSGSAGGLVTKRHPELAAHTLQAIELPPAQISAAMQDQNTLALYSLDIDEHRYLRSFTQLYPSGPGADWPIVRLFQFKIVRGRPIQNHNLEPYVDLLNPAATDAFLEINYKPYHDLFGKDFGEFMPGIFTDEPNYRGGPGLPWTPELLRLFEERTGYNLFDRLPLLFFDGENCHQTRYDFWKLVTQLFLENFSRRMFEWCEKHKLLFTGHYLAEDTLFYQVRVIGAAMPHYEFMQVPGIDHLGRNIDNPLTLKQVSSVAHQFGRNRILCEIFGVSGHSMSFEDQKWIADFHFALGITFINQHLTLYSMKGNRKRDYPPTFSYHQPYWPYYKYINDYFARCAYALSQGKHCADILVLHPIASAWATYQEAPQNETPPNDEVKRYDAGLASLVESLLALHRDFDLGDEMILSRHAKVEDGRLRVREAAYSLVIVPPSLVWSSDTVQLLSSFLRAGGIVVFVGETPRLIDGMQGDFSELFAAEGAVFCENNLDDLRRVLDMRLEWDVNVLDKHGDEIGDVYYHHRKDGIRHIYFFSSKNREKTLQTRISLRTVGRVEEWDLVEGSVREVPARVVDERLECETIFPPAGSHLFVVEEGAAPRISPPPPIPISRREEMPLNGPWNFRRTHPNSITLDYCRLAIGNDEFGDKMPVWKARHLLKQRFGLMDYNMVQPWAIRKMGVNAPKGATARLQFDFEVDTIPKEIFLVLEQASRWRITLNGHFLPSETSSWHWDKQFGKISISRETRTGVNQLEISCAYDAETEIEDIYLIGEFGVKKGANGQFLLTGEPTHLQDGDWVLQGYPFYAGNMIYSATFDLTAAEGRRFVRVRLNEPKGSLFRVSLNGSQPRLLAWQPWEVDVTDLVRTGQNRLEIEVCGTLRNTMGPLHHKLGDKLPWTGPGQFTDEANWVDDYQFAPYGLLGGATVVIEYQ